MWRFEVLYRENGILKHRGFGYRDKFEGFLRRAQKKSGVVIIETIDAELGIHTRY